MRRSLKAHRAAPGRVKGFIPCKKTTIIGVGLIGGSLALELKGISPCAKIVGVDRTLGNLKVARKRGLVDSYTTDIAKGVKNSELVVVATPVRSIERVLKIAAPHLKKGCIVTDVGSVKEKIAKKAASILPEGVFFVPGHPIAGTEFSGAEAALKGLFKGKKCILTPTASTDRKALKKIASLWRAAGSEVVVMDARTHDKALASVSHLPHFVAYALVGTVADIDKKTSVLPYSAGGLRDFTRIAASSPQMWTDICAMNKRALLKVVKKFEKTLEALRTLVEKGDFHSLRKKFERAKKVRGLLNPGVAKPGGC
jgi:prephenate dehydrogenase